MCHKTTATNTRSTRTTGKQPLNVDLDPWFQHGVHLWWITFTEVVSQDHNGGENPQLPHDTVACTSWQHAAVCLCFLWHWDKQPHWRGGAAQKIWCSTQKYLIWKINGYALGLHINWVFVSKILIRLYSHCPPYKLWPNMKTGDSRQSPSEYLSKHELKLIAERNRIFVFFIQKIPFGH